MKADINELLTRGVENIIPNKSALEEILRSGKKLNIYLGIDVTSPKIHIGHGVPLRKLQQFIELGHNVTLLFGDFTTKVGDTSDKESERPRLTDDEIAKNVATYKQQAGKIVDLSKIKIRFNSEWLTKLGLANILSLFQHFSFNDFVSRELIKKRLETGSHIKLDEVIYPTMQGYDSYFMDTDIQLGGTDQTFNMQAGRTLQKDLRHKESFIIANGFLEGTDGRKMSKSWGNAIWIEDAPDEMFGKTMSLRDELINQYFVLATNLPLNQIPKAGHPMELKKKLAHQIVTEFHSKKEADKAQENFEKIIQAGETPAEIPVFKLSSLLENATIIDLLEKSKTVASRGEARRLLAQRGVAINQLPITNIQLPMKTLKAGDIIKIGKRKWLKIE
jgi:tyrosyl-tRNA synthetase